jgi:hypothetical protein
MAYIGPKQRQRLVRLIPLSVVALLFPFPLAGKAIAYDLGFFSPPLDGEGSGVG